MTMLTTSSLASVGSDSRNDDFPESAPEERLTARSFSNESSSVEPPSDGFESVFAKIVDSYTELAMRHAIIEEIGPSLWFATIIVLKGVYGEGATPEEALEDLRVSIPAWIAISRRIGACDIPPMEGLELNSIDRRGDGKTAEADNKG